MDATMLDCEMNLPSLLIYDGCVLAEENSILQFLSSPIVLFVIKLDAAIVYNDGVFPYKILKYNGNSLSECCYYNGAKHDSLEVEIYSEQKLSRELSQQEKTFLTYFDDTYSPLLLNEKIINYQVMMKYKIPNNEQTYTGEYLTSEDIVNFSIKNNITIDCSDIPPKENQYQLNSHKSLAVCENLQSITVMHSNDKQQITHCTPSHHFDQNT
jgi:hypothetical protein